MLLRSVLALGAALIFVSACNARETPRIDRAEWRSLPDANGMARYYPERATKEGIAGRAVIDCRLTAEGRADDCKVVSETPEGYGFGEAAVKMSVIFAFVPPMRDGKPVDDARRLIPISFAGRPPGGSVMRAYQPTPDGKAIGEDAIMIVRVKEDTPRNGSDRFACPDGEGECEPRLVTWPVRPDREQARTILAGVEALASVTNMSCEITSDGALKGCRTTGEVGPEASKAVAAAMAVLRAPLQSDDGLPTAGSTMAIRWNWPELVKGVALNPEAKP
jgi:TonB family protein